jgi:hypothetical protein
MNFDGPVAGPHTLIFVLASAEIQGNNIRHHAPSVCRRPLIGAFAPLNASYEMAAMGATAGFVLWEDRAPAYTIFANAQSQGTA